MPLFLVETLSQFRMRYAIQANTLEDAKDCVVMQEAGELGQLHLGETIFSGRQIASEEVSKLFLEDHPYLKDADIDLTRYVTKMKY